MNLGTHMPDGERRKSIDIEICRSKVKVTLSIHMFATRLSHLWCVTDFCNLNDIFITGSVSLQLYMVDQHKFIKEVKVGCTCMSLLLS